MHIGIDARLIGETGVGRYIRNLIAHLGLIDTKNAYTIFLPSGAYESFTPPNNRWKKIRCDIHWHTIKEQLLMPTVFTQEGLDLLHVPYFNAPIFYAKPYILTIHDLTILHVTTGKATTLPKPLFWLRRLGYQIILRTGIRKAAHCIAVSNATKDDVVKNIHIPEEKITVTYEGIDTHIKTAMTKAHQVMAPYFLYVGNAYPHKNLEFVIRAFGAFLTKTNKSHTLVLVGKEDFFYKRLKRWVATLPYTERVKFFGPADDAQLASLYRQADAFVFPSLMEGFGLPALEAISCGCPVICSDIPVFRELFADIPTYIDPHREETLVHAMEKAIVRKEVVLTDKQKQLLVRYDWKTMAEQTVQIYERFFV